MKDWSVALDLIKSTINAQAKASIKPSLKDKEAMSQYAKATGQAGKKAIFCEEQQSDMIEWSI